MQRKWNVVEAVSVGEHGRWGRMKKEELWDIACSKLLQELVKNGLHREDELPPKPRMPNNWDGKSPAVLDIPSDDVDVVLEVGPRKPKAVKIHRPDHIKALFFELHRALRHKTIREVCHLLSNSTPSKSTR